MNANLTQAIPKKARPSPSSINSDISGAAILIAGTFTAAALGILGTFNPLWSAYGLASIVTILLFVTRPHIIVLATIVAAFSVTPTFIPKWISVGPFQMQLYEPLLILSLLWAVRQVLAPSTKKVAGWLLAWLSVGIIAAALGSPSFDKFLGDIRQPIALIAALVVAAAVAKSPTLPLAVRTSTWVLWISAILTLGAATLGIKISGRTEGAALFDRDSAGATRILTSATFFALTTLCVCIALAILGRHTFASTWRYWLPTLPILFLAFSRNHLIAIAGAIIVATVAARSGAKIAEFGYKMTLTLFGGALILVSAITIGDGIPGAGWISTQISAYTDRVIGGLTNETLARDPSALFRESENALLISHFADSPFFGNGFGYAYRAPVGDPGTFMHDKAPWYAHNFYLWSAVKTGLIGLSLIFLAVVPAVWNAIFRNRNSYAQALAATFVGLLGVAIYAPLPIDSPASILVGAVLGAMVGLTSQKPEGSASSTSTESRVMSL